MSYRQGVTDLARIVGDETRPLPFNPEALGMAIHTGFKEYGRENGVGDVEQLWETLPAATKGAYRKAGEMVGRMVAAGIAGINTAEARKLYRSGGKP